ncbi:MAG: hypothetical protein ACKV2Q_36825 [Planctomycetaceae bacterium]
MDWISVAKGVAKETWHYAKLSERWRDFKDGRRLLKVMPELRAINDELANRLHQFDYQFDADEFLALLFDIALNRTQSVMEKYYAGEEVVVSFKTEYDTDRTQLRCWYCRHLPPHRVGKALKVIPKDGTAAGDSYRNKSPVIVSDLETRRETYGDVLYAKYSKIIGSLIVWPVLFEGDEIAGLLKVDSPKKHLFVRNTSTDALMKHVTANFLLVFAIGRQLAYRTLPNDSNGVPRMDEDQTPRLGDMQ